ncbi:MAG: sporulation integral membrane protein YtvI [Clostridiales bacterium]|jgi:sporulation integral membrane protein YtvI|nr:sporulation integral membrane protein YtvI [Clostridiales bacterium]
MDFYNRHKAAANKLFVVIMSILGAYIFFRFCFGLASPFVLGFLSALLLSPLAGFFERLRLPRAFSAFLCVLIFAGALGFLGFFLSGKLLGQSSAFFAACASYITGFQDKLRELTAFAPPPVGEALAGLLSAAAAGITSMAGAGTGSIVAAFPKLVVSLFLTLISAFFFTKDRALIARYIREKSPRLLREKYSAVREGLSGALSGYLKAQVIIVSLSTVVCSAALFLLKYPYALFMGLVIALVDALPVFGGGAVLLPWAALRLLSGDYAFGAALLALYAIVLVTRQTVEPRVLGRQIGVHPLVTLLSVFAGLKLFGALGFLIGPALMVTLKEILSEKRAENS